MALFCSQMMPMSEPALPAPSRIPGVRAIVASVLIVLLAALAAAVLRPLTPPGSIALVFLVAVAVQRRPVRAVDRHRSIRSGVSRYNFFFVEPVLTFRVALAGGLLALSVFIWSPALTGTLAGRLREQATAAQERARLLEHLSQLSSTLGAVRLGG